MRKPISFRVSKEDAVLISKIVDRALKFFPQLARKDIEMDITACHCNGNPLNLQRLLLADEANFTHDVGGISSNLNRTTGKLDRFFSPRCSAPTKQGSR